MAIHSAMSLMHHILSQITYMNRKVGMIPTILIICIQHLLSFQVQGLTLRGIRIIQKVNKFKQRDEVLKARLSSFLRKEGELTVQRITPIKNHVLYIESVLGKALI